MLYYKYLQRWLLYFSDLHFSRYTFFKTINRLYFFRAIYTKIEQEVQSSHMQVTASSSQVSPNINSLHSCGMFVKTDEPIWVHYY